MTAYCRFILSLAMTLGIAAPALADPPLEPSACNVRGAKRVAIGSFHFTAGELRDFRLQHPFATQRPGAKANARKECKRATLPELISVIGMTPNKARNIVNSGEGPKPELWCGIVDEWLYAALQAQQYCNSPSLGNGNAYFKVDASYSDFNNTDNHHLLYKPNASLVHADSDIVLEGSCYVCTVRSIGTATAIPQDQIKVRTPAKGD